MSAHYKCPCGWHGHEDEVEERVERVSYEAHGARAFRAVITISCPMCLRDQLDECRMCDCCGENPQSEAKDAEGLCDFCLTCDEDIAMARRRVNPKHAVKEFA